MDSDILAALFYAQLWCEGIQKETILCGMATDSQWKSNDGTTRKQNDFSLLGSGPVGDDVLWYHDISGTLLYILLSDSLKNDAYPYFSDLDESTTD